MRPLRRGSVSTLIPIVIFVIVAILVVVWMNRPGPDMERDRAVHGEVLSSLTGLARPVKNTLSEAYTDRDGDLIADVPPEFAKQVDPPELVFAFIAGDVKATSAVFAPLTDALAKATGKPVRFVELNDVDEQLARLHDGQIQICAFNTGSVPIAVDAAGFVPVSQLGGDRGPQNYLLNLVALSTSGISDINQIRGEEIALTEIGSNSGFKAPLVLLNQKFGLVPGRDFAIRYSGSHDASIDGLANGTYRVIAVASDVLARAQAAGRIKANQYRVLYTSDPFPTASFGYAYNLKPDLAAKIRDVLDDFSFINTPMGAFFAPAGQTHLVKLDYRKDFELVRQIDNAIGYEHKLRGRATTEPTTRPAVQ